MMDLSTEPSTAELSTGWGLKRSWWLALIVLSLGLLSWVAFLYLGARTNLRRWRIWAALYLALAVASIALLAVGGDSNSDVWSGIGTLLLLGLWVGSLAHGLIIRREALVRLGFASRLQQERVLQLESELSERLAQGSSPARFEAPLSQDIPQAAAVALYASWGQRVAAWLVDVVLCYFAVVPIAIVLAFALPDVAATDDGALALVLLAFLVDVLLLAVYLTVCHGHSRGQTLGKRAVGIAVRRAESLERVGYPWAFVRALAALLPWALTVALVPIIGPWFWLLVALDNLWPLWDSRKQALHDRVARTVVIRA
jgi:uncharacterized RDD family membrane protein YckC